MSIKLMSAVWEVPLSDSEKLVLLALADCANDEGACWPSMKTLSDKCSKSDRTVQAAIKELVANGHLSRIDKPGKGCLYYVHPVRPSGMQGTSPVAFHYTYRITCSETGEFYVGARSTYDTPDSDRYMGSGEWVKKAKEHGLSLRKEVIAIFPSREALGVAEQQLTKAVITHPLCRNKKVASARNLSQFGGTTPEAASPTPEAASPTPEAASDKPPFNHQEPSKAKTQRAREISDRWKPQAFAADTKCAKIIDGWPPGEVETQLEHFTAHHTARSSRFTDWQAAWKTWVLNSRKFNNGRTNNRASHANGDGRSTLARVLDTAIESLRESP